MRILVACEESQAVTIELRRLGHEAYSCDIEPCSGGHPEWHLQVDALELLKMRWDMILAFVPCTFMTKAGAVRMRVNGVIQQERFEKAMKAKEFFMAFFNADCDKICIENPIPMKLIGLPPYTQVIQPWMFIDPNTGNPHPYTKRTCLWLKGLEPLIPEILHKPEGTIPFINGGSKDANGNYRRFQGRKERDPKIRAKTFPGVARAMAEQWAGNAIETMIGGNNDN